jgi:hypothetical protein
MNSCKKLVLQWWSRAVFLKAERDAVEFCVKLENVVKRH